MAKKTAFDDLFSDDFGKLGLQRLEELNAMALTLKENLKASAQTLSAKVRGASPSTASGAKEIENTKKMSMYCVVCIKYRTKGLI